MQPSHARRQRIECKWPFPHLNEAEVVCTEIFPSFSHSLQNVYRLLRCCAQTVAGLRPVRCCFNSQKLVSRLPLHSTKPSWILSCHLFLLLSPNYQALAVAKRYSFTEATNFDTTRSKPLALRSWILLMMVQFSMHKVLGTYFCPSAL